MTGQKSARWLGVPGRGSHLIIEMVYELTPVRTQQAKRPIQLGKLISVYQFSETLCLCNFALPLKCVHTLVHVLYSVFKFLMVFFFFLISFLLRKLEFSFGIWSHKRWNDFLFQTNFYFIYLIELPSREILKPLVYNHWLFLMSWTWELQRKEADFIR